MAMVASNAGWSILTPLGCRRAQRFLDDVELMPLPFAPMSRRISLMSRKETLEGMSAKVVPQLRGLLQEIVVEPAITQAPWLAGQLRVL